MQIAGSLDQCCGVVVNSAYYGASTNPLPPPSVPGETDAERMDTAVRVPKAAYLKEKALSKRVRTRKRAEKKPA